MAKTTKQGVITKKHDRRTAVVETMRMKAHPVYKKRFKVTKKYLADDKNDKFKIGDIVIIEETRPVSKMKRFKIVEKVGEINLAAAEKKELSDEELILKREREKKEEKKTATEAVIEEEEEEGENF